MDIGLLIGLMIVVYVVPELIKRMKKTKKPNRYPQIPLPIPSPEQNYPAPGIPGGLSQGVKPPLISVYEMSGEGMAGDEGDPDWERKEDLTVLDVSGPLETGQMALRFDPTEAAQGVVWAEVFASPLSMRPNRRSLRRFGHGTM